MTPPLPRRPFTDREMKLAIALGRCTFAPGSFDKRFARDLAELARFGAGITEKQAALLPRMVNRYRRQIDADELDPADQHLLKKAVPALQSGLFHEGDLVKVGTAPVCVDCKVFMAPQHEESAPLFRGRFRCPRCLAEVQQA